jgi:flagellar hook-basal body protein
MSFFTSLTGLNAATTQLSVTSNNIANAGTTGFKRSRSDFGDIFATSPLQKASTVVGQGTALKQVTQEFSQGNIELSGNSLDLAVTGEGFFPIKSSDGQDLFTRNGSFLLDEQNTVVNSAGQFLRVASVDSLGKADFQADLVPLAIAPSTVGQAIATSQIDLAINFPAESLPATQLNDANVETIKPFNPDDSTTYAKSAAVTIFDENGNDFLVTFYYRRVGVASSTDPFNKWQTHILLDGQEITPGLGQATSADGTPLFVDKYGTIIPETELPVINERQISQKYILDDLADATVSTPAKAAGEKLGEAYLDGNDGVNFAPIIPSIEVAIDDSELSNIGTYSATVGTPTTPSLVFTDIADNVITATGHGYKTGDQIVFNDQGAANPTGLTSGTTFFAIYLTDDTFSIASTSANASSGTAATITDTAANTVLSFDSSSEFTVAAGHGLETGDRVVYNANGGVVASGLIDGATYYAINSDSESVDSDGITDDTVRLATSYANAIAGTGLDFSGGNTAQSLDLAEIVNFTMTAADGSEEIISSLHAASASIDVIQTDEIESNDRISVELTDEDGTSRVLTTGALSADASVTEIIAALNTASNATSILPTGVTGNVLTSGDHGYTTGDQVVFNAHGDALHGTGLTDGQTYYIINLTDDTFSVASTYANAISGTAAVLSGAPTSEVTFDSASGRGEYAFSASTDVNGDVDLASRIIITRADGRNFSIAEGADHSLSGEAMIYENISLTSAALSTTASSDTENGKALDRTTTVAELVSTLASGSAGTSYAVGLSTVSSNTLAISRADGANFSVTTSRIPNNTTDLFSIGGAAVAEGDTSDRTTTGALAPDLSAAFDLTIDEDPNEPLETDSVTIDLSSMAIPANDGLHGSDIAELMTKEINRQLGDRRFFDLSSDANRQFRMTFTADRAADDPAQVIDVYIPASSVYTEDSLSAEIERQLQAATGTTIDVSYNRASKGFVFLTEDDRSQMSITNLPESASLTGSATPNVLFGLNNLSADFTLDSRGRYPAEVLANGEQVLEEAQQRYGIQVEFESDDTGGRFSISSGTTGDSSAIRIDNISDAAASLFGFNATGDEAANLEVVAVDLPTAVRGVDSTPAKVFGRQVGIDPDETFFVDDSTNQFTVTVDNVTETFRLPVGTYSLPRFREALENRINAMEDSRGNSISGVSVTFDQENEVFTFTSGTTGNSAFLQISGPARYGLENIDSNAGQTVTYRSPVVDRASNGDPILVAKIDGVYEEFTESGTTLASLPDEFPDFDTDPEYRPLFLDKGELTFDTAGNLISPIDGISLNNVVIGGSGNTLNIDIDYAGSTQFSGDFSVNSQGQNGQPNGSLVSVDIADDGLVTASYSNGTQDLKGKIVLATFSTPNGLRQLGDSTFLESNESGAPTLGEPGGAGFGTIRAGARERANVDLTSELVDLITAQRNFQANAKAIETSSTLTSTIINIRS